MNSLRKILVVDSGRREEFDSLSQELAGLGVSSVTASFEAAEEVLGVIDRPSAIFVKMPHARHSSDYADLMSVARDLKRRERILGVPVIVWDGCAAADGTISRVLQSQIGPSALSEPDL